MDRVINGDEALSRAAEVLQIVRAAGLVRARDLTARGISPTHLQRLYEQGLLGRSGRGVYFAPSIGSAGADNRASVPEADEKLSLAEVCLRVPRGVVCLLSALALPRPDDAIAARRLARPTNARSRPHLRLSALARRAYGRGIVWRRHSGSGCGNQHADTRLQPREDGRRLLQVPQPRRRRRGDRSTEGLSAKKSGERR